MPVCRRHLASLHQLAVSIHAAHRPCRRGQAPNREMAAVRVYVSLRDAPSFAKRQSFVCEFCGLALNPQMGPRRIRLAPTIGDLAKWRQLHKINMLCVTVHQRYLLLAATLVRIVRTLDLANHECPWTAKFRMATLPLAAGRQGTR